MVKIHGTRRLHAIFFIQPHFRGNPSDGGGDRRNGRRGQVSEGAVAGQHNYRPGFVRWRKTVKPNIAALYSAGQLASASQPEKSFESCGLAS